MFEKNDNKNQNGKDKTSNMVATSQSTSSQTSMGLASETLVRIQKDLWDFARKRTLDSGDTRINPEMLQALLDHGESMAREEEAKLFDPSSSRHDVVKEHEYDKATEEIENIKNKQALAREDIRKRRDALAESGEITPRPETPWMPFFIGSLLIGSTVAPTLHSCFFADIGDAGHAWFFSVASGTMAGLLVSWALTATFDSAIAYQILGLVAGLLFGVAMLILRLSTVDSQYSLLMAIALATLEISIVIILDWIGRGLRRRFAKHEEERKARSVREAYLISSQTELETWNQELETKQKIVKEFEAHLFDREHRHALVENLINGARQAVKDGYLAGIAENEGKIRGGK